MQLHLEVEQLNLLANILLERVGELSAQRPSADGLKSKIDIQRDFRRSNELLDKVLAHDLRLDSDELEQLAGLLTARKASLGDEIARQPNAAAKTGMQRKSALLEEVLERVDEACAMI
ncbi:MAG: hypothetical protein ACLPPV_16395 [Candidatus Korobacteraceae bacterium]|jgi:hypothetical protein